MVTLVPGNYQLTVNNIAGDTASWVKLEWVTIDTVTVNANRTGGGLRLKEIKSYNTDNTLLTKRYYEYRVPGTSKSSALIGRIPDPYLQYTERDKRWRPRTPFPGADVYYTIEWVYTTIHSSDVSNEARPVGNNISYEYVTEYNYDANAGKTVYRFSKPDYFLPGATWVDTYLDPVVKGKPLETTHYRKGVLQGEYYPVNREETSYYFSIPPDSTYQAGYKIKMLASEIDEVIEFAHFFYPSEFLIYNYTQNNYWVAPKERLVTQFETDTTKYTQQYTKFDYTALLVSKETTTTSVDTLVTEYDYFHPNISIYDHLNRPSEIIRKWRRDSLVKDVFDARKLTYAYNDTTHVLLPLELYRAELVELKGDYEVSSYYVPEVTFESYDSSGNLRSIVDKAAVRTSFIWGPNNMVLAKATNANPDQIAFTSFEYGASGGGWTYTENSGITAKTGSKSHVLNGANISRSGLDAGTAYTLSFWTINGNPSVTNTTWNNSHPTPGSEWVYCEYIVAGTATVTISGTGTTAIDELRLYPTDAQMTSYSYKDGFGVNSMTDPNGLSAYFDYDDVGRLKLSFDDDRNIVVQVQYQYGSAANVGLNQITTNAINKAGITWEGNIPATVSDSLSQTIKYFDGLGRLIQTVITRGSPDSADIVQPMVYDNYGREAYKYLPVVTGSDGLYKSSIVNPFTHAYSGAAASFYAPGSNNDIADDSIPYSVTRFEQSPLSRVIKQGAPGAAWQPNDTLYSTTDHTVKMRYTFNDSADVVLF
ncbi:MAG: hypothetical protein HC859_06235, partial [Bacteroidia bacterium]|nr:hypothetical protein [Bacteroidia bacterium]